MTTHVVLAATVCAGLLAGLYFTFAIAIMPALHGLDDVAFVNAMKRINVSIINPAFLSVFFTAPTLAVTAAVMVRSQIALTAAALGIITLLLTITLNVPLNNKLAAGASRGVFEGPWVLANTLRTITAVASFILILLIHSPSD